MRREQRAASAEGDNDRLEALGEEGLRRGGDFGLGLDWQPGEDGELGLVGANEARLAGALDIEFTNRRRRIEHRSDAMPLAKGERRIDRLERDFELGEDEVAGLEIVAGPRDVLRTEIAVRALDDEDAVVARPVDEDRRSAGRLTADALNMRGVDARALEILEHAIAQHVVADFRHHDDRGAELRRRDRLVGALSPMAHLEPRRSDRLAPDRHAIDIGHEIDVARADNPDARALLCHCCSSP